jgi:putative ABC transport system permease protein
MALGASRGRLLAQSLIESALIAIGGAAAGILLAIACVRMLGRLNPPGVPRLDAVRVDIPVLLFSLAVRESWQSQPACCPRSNRRKRLTV